MVDPITSRSRLRCAAIIGEHQSERTLRDSNRILGRIITVATAVSGFSSSGAPLRRSTAPTRSLRSDSRRLDLGSINILWLLSRPKGRNFRGEELGRGRRETESPQGRQNLFGRLARLPRAAPFKRPNRILGPSTQGGNIGARVYKAVSERYAPKR